MAHDLTQKLEYRYTMERLEAAKRQTDDGVEYWMAREVYPVLGYSSLPKFRPVIERVIDALRANDLDPSHHVADVSRVMGGGKGSKLTVDDLFLSRAACYLIAMNGDPSKPEVAAAQAYFTIQARRMELVDQQSDDDKRLKLREKVARSFRTVSGIAKNAGVRNHMQAIFHDARYHGLYGMSSRDVKKRKRLHEKSNLFDHAAPLELSANDFQMNLASNVIENENIRGEQQAIKKNKELAADVRRVMQKGGATLPEDLPLAEPISEVKKRVRAQKKQKNLIPPGDQSNSSESQI